MQIIQSIVQSATAVSCRRWLHNLLAEWKSRKFANSRRTQQSMGQVDEHWQQRIDDAVACPDNASIARVSNAGTLADGVLVMHNGIRVGGLSYCGAGMMNMLVENRGVHEPQEERAFGDVLPHIHAGAVMLELGAYWGFYSLWFQRQIADAECHLLEPHPANIRSGKLNFDMNRAHATFKQAYAGGADGTAQDGVPVVTVSSYCRERNIERLAILHADIQGAEVDMLHGAATMLAARQIDYLFISTHSNALHNRCIDRLRQHDYAILASADMEQSYSVDGLIVARGPHLSVPDTLTISHKNRVDRRQAA